MVKKRNIYIVAGIISLVLYVAGIFTGIMTQKVLFKPTEAEISSLKEGMGSLKTNMENIQLEYLYLSLSKGEKTCDFLVSAVDQMEGELYVFWSKLPRRLEEYEKYEQISPDYVELKRDYTFVLLRTWMLSSTLKNECNKDIVPILYFYSRECTRCIEQGEVLDRYKVSTEATGKKVMIFTVDMNMNEQIVSIIKNTYNITEAPSIVAGKNVYSGFLSDSEMSKITV